MKINLNRRRIILLSLASVALLALSAFWQRRLLFPRFEVVAPGRLYRGSLPSAHRLAEIKADTGLKAVLCLLGSNDERVAPEEAAASRLGLRFFHVPISSTQPFPADHLAELRRIYADATNYPLLVHCEQGIARTGVAIALYRIEKQGWSGDAAVREMIQEDFPVREESEDMLRALRAWRADARPSANVPRVH